ncbi:MAG: AMP-binding protein [candidate division Zixibacteria bacterium]|nr:AMP-binding protein [candidate division Zixibacteria bacterium]
MPLSNFLENAAFEFPFKTAVITEAERVDYISLYSHALRFASALVKYGVKPGDRIVLFIDNSIGYAVSYFGTLLAGAVVVGQSTANKERHMRNIINHCTATAVVTGGRHLKTISNIIGDCPSLKAIIYDGKLPSAMKPSGAECRELFDIYLNEEMTANIPSREEDELAQIIYTSGTTGNPKGVMLSNKNLRANTESIIRYLGLTYEDRVMSVLPFYYSYGNSLLLTHIACGGSIVIDNRFAYPQKVLQRMVEEQVTGFSGVPSTFAILAHKAGLADFDLSSLRYITQAGGPMSPALANELKGALPNVKIFIMYGQTEASARLSYLEPERLTDKSGSIGKAIPGVELKVLDKKGQEVKPGDVGEIVARGDNIMMGYWQNPSETKMVLKEGSLYTGDLATVDEDGFIYIVSRQSDMIKSGAHRISPKEIEELIMEDDRVHEVAIVGEPDEIMGETIVALVVPRPEKILTDKDILSHCRKHLPLYKVPKRVEFRESLPKTASGKIKKHVLREELTKT